MAEVFNNIAKAGQDAATSITETAKTAYNYVADQSAATTSEGQANIAKEQVKSDQTTLGQKVDGAGDYISNKLDQKSNEASAELNKQKLENK